ncbi:MAG: bifunctional precorrin-2 dehydrogenase/sirohydrochlorin ferrochelatase [Actinobacteria bacterium]|nr:bifunctional precorrin-2 dehydrogenase/sirohydrochlorin ferrochelatase [Actinomycetota bacterium]MBT3686667.1 bifunctional precorrin-2 dehydrogenase/sirohydrochlorin ferrochelatase [Actinomycetota bacterium]MBT4037337.1 bifunctional precorrin-2 dehydrogenase/sirohydrochlorin ferrochelatase [Actinomycetota bacterium]MBT4278011.1 bifunctional precorrin-2 dehydrogenase/sirohydrochlorin ferrochelatase [Actinomycetota bacterium]MBT4343369.1 bifunctional precorrin-2 dehydrogenase/sirohydrochlorin 
MSPTPYPVNLDLTGRRVLVVGAGPVAARKVAGLLDAGADVTVVAPTAVDEIADDSGVRWHERPYRRGEVASYRLAVTATGDPDVDDQVHRDAEAAGVWLNSADDPERCTFTLPAVSRHGDLQVTVSTNGNSPAVSRWLRQSLFDDIGPEHAAVLDLASEVRTELREATGTSESPAWGIALNDALVDTVRRGDLDAARAALRCGLGLPETPTLEPAP